MKKTLFEVTKRLPGAGEGFIEEEVVEDVKFEIFKLNSRPRPRDKEKILVICCFSEFGCETVGAMYCLPRIMRDYPDMYKIVVGWHGRKYLYQHLADEFWEMNSEHMWLREYARAFHNESKSLERIEKKLTQYGRVVPSEYMGKVAISGKCFSCGFFWGTVSMEGEINAVSCPRCRGTDILRPIFQDISYWKQRATRIPEPSPEKMRRAADLLGPKPVGVFARARKCYGRNLQTDFYVGLVDLLRKKGFSPIWLGEEVSTMPCPVPDVVDFSRMKESKDDLEPTFAIVKQCEFTVQFWTASSRLAGMMGVPYLLFESPDQIWGQGQEGIRRNLCDFGPRKLSINHYLNVYNDNQSGLGVVDDCVDEMIGGNWSDHLGLVDHAVVSQMKVNNNHRIGG